MVDVEFKSAKYEASQQRRLQSLREKQELQKQKQKLVSDALKSIDNPDAANNKKRIVFDSDSDGEEVVVAKKPKLTSSRNLFDDDDDQEPDLEKQDPNTLMATGRITGKGSSKLMQLESKYGYDSRFQLDNTFMEDGDKEDDADMDRAQEKERQLRLLSMVVGRDVKARHESKISKSSVRPFQRFDPENREHLEWMKNYEKTQNLDENEDEKKEEDEPVFTETKAVIDERRFYEMNEDFAAELRAKLVSGQKETFSFLTQKKKFEEQGDGKPQPEKKIASEVVKPKKKQQEQLIADKPCFFFEITDPEFYSKLDKFRATVEKKSRQRKWESAKDAFRSLARQVHKNRLRELEVHKKKK